MSSGSTNAGSGGSATDQHREFMRKLGLAKQSATKVREREKVRQAALTLAEKTLRQANKDLKALEKQLKTATGSTKTGLLAAVMKKKTEIEGLEKAVTTAAGSAEYQHNAVLEVLAKQRALELSACPMDDFAAMDLGAKATALDEILIDNTVTVDPDHTGTVSIDGLVSFDPVALRNIPMEKRAELLAGLSGSADEQQAVLAKMSKSGEMRLRHPGHAVEGQTFLNGKKGAMGTTLTDDLDTLYTNATPREKYRAFDLKNGYSTLARGDSKRADRCLEFAMRMDPAPANLFEVVDYFEFYNAYCDDKVSDMAWDKKRNGTEDEKRMSIKALRKRARSDLAAQQTDVSLTGKSIPDDKMDDAKDSFNRYASAVTALGGGAGSVACTYDPQDTSGNRGRIRAVGRTLPFKSVPTAAYHTKKHYSELSTGEKAFKTDGTLEENQVACYLNGARQAVHGGGDGPSSVGQFGGESHFFKGPSCTAITWIAGGQSGIATYFNK
ncbi:MAG: hypothetical protein AB3N17_09385 [Tateyamaria sp.]